jgi:hypothetical protein
MVEARAHHPAKAAQRARQDVEEAARVELRLRLRRKGEHGNHARDQQGNPAHRPSSTDLRINGRRLKQVPA